jgi:phosphoribosyl 1,2-cyclic phosphodiesterase
LKIGVLGSGSSGNASLVINRCAAVLVDAGFSAKGICDRLNQVDVKPQDISAILITHEHIDHIRGAGIFSRKFSVPVYATEQTLCKGKHVMGKLPDVRVIEPGKPFCLADFQIHPFSISHDAADPVGYLISSDGVSAGVCTDLGYVTPLVRERLSGCHALVLEMNHDMEMLMAGPYPWSLKQRIRSRTGHLSNDAAGEFLRELWHPNLQYVVLAHLSQKNNLPELAAVTAESSLRDLHDGTVTKVFVAVQHKAGELLSLTESKTEGDDE